MFQLFKRERRQHDPGDLHQPYHKTREYYRVEEEEDSIRDTGGDAGGTCPAWFTQRSALLSIKRLYVELQLQLHSMTRPIHLLR